MATKSKLQPKRKYGAESEASVLVDWLNAVDVKHPSLHRVLAVRKFLLMRESHAEQWRLFSVQEKASLEVAKVLADYINGVYDPLNQLLKRYRMTPMLEPQLSAGGAHINWRAPRTRGFVMIRRDPFVPAREVDEPEAIQRILNLSRTPYLSRVRQCDHCKRWLYARRSDQRFCTGKHCNQKHRETGPDFKKQRRDYIKKYRRRLKELSGIRSGPKRHSRPKARRATL